MNAPDRSAQAVDVLAVLRFDAGDADIGRRRAGIGNAIERSRMSDEAIAAVAELHAAGKRVIAAFGAIGRFPAPVATTGLRVEAVAALVALFAALVRMEPQP